MDPSISHGDEQARSIRFTRINLHLHYDPEEDALVALQAAEEAKRQAIAAANAAAAEKANAVAEDMSYANNTTNATANQTKPAPVKKKVAGKKPKLTAKERKERNVN